MSDREAAIGIDLGTTNSCLGIYRFGKVEIIANEFGNRTTPSIVAFDDLERFVGEAAKQQMHRNQENTIYGVKRLIGHYFDDPMIQEYMQHWPFEVINDNNLPKIRVSFKGVKQVLTPEEISSMILVKMKQTAEDYLGKPVKNAVITVPAYFNDLQRKATMDAAEIAGLKVLRLINEPTAASLAYGFDHTSDKPKNVLIFDLGGGTFDVSIVVINKTGYKVVGTGGNTHLGGDDFDRRLVIYFVEEFYKKHKKDISTNKKAIAKLRKGCEILKASLTLQSTAKLEVEMLYEGIDFVASISRARFEELCIDLFKSTIVTVGKTLVDANMTKTCIDEIILVGGSTRIPRIQQMVKDFFDGKMPTKSINPDEAVAYGACIAAAIFNGDGSDDILNTVLSDVTPLSLGIGCVPNFEKMFVMISKNTTVPAKHSTVFSTCHDNQVALRFPVYQGESVNAKQNILLGSFVLTDIPPAPHGVQSAAVTFEINENGILKVKAVLQSTLKEINILINTKGNICKQEIDSMAKQSFAFQKHDLKQKQAHKAKDDLEQFCWKINDFFSNNLQVPKHDVAVIMAKCKYTLNWLNATGSIDKEEYENHKEKLKAVCANFLPSYIK